MRIAVMGTGAMGALFGAALATAGNDVTFVARGEHLAAIRRDGLRVEGDRGSAHVQPAQATDDPAEIGEVDLVLFCVKLWDVEPAAEKIRPVVGADTAVIPLQNGIDAPERLAAILGPHAVMGGTAMATGAIVAPGVIRQTGTFQRLTFGELNGRRSARAEAIRDCGEAAGFDAIIADDIEVAMWEKFNMLVPHSGVTALTRSPIGRF